MQVRQSVTVIKENHPRHGQAGTVEGFATVGVGKNRQECVNVRFHCEGDPDEGELVALPLTAVRAI